MNNKYDENNYNNIQETTTERASQFNGQTSPKPTAPTYVLLPNSDTLKSGGTEYLLTSVATSNLNSNRVLPITDQFDAALGKIDNSV